MDTLVPNKFKEIFSECDMYFLKFSSITVQQNNYENPGKCVVHLIYWLGNYSQSIMVGRMAVHPRTPHPQPETTSIEPVSG